MWAQKGQKKLLTGFNLPSTNAYCMMYEHLSVERQTFRCIILFISTFPNRSLFSDWAFHSVLFPCPVFLIFNEFFRNVAIRSHRNKSPHIKTSINWNLSYVSFSKHSIRLIYWHQFKLFFTFSFQKYPEFNLGKYCHQSLLRFYQEYSCWELSCFMYRIQFHLAPQKMRKMVQSIFCVRFAMIINYCEWNSTIRKINEKQMRIQRVQCPLSTHFPVEKTMQISQIHLIFL